MNLEISPKFKQEFNKNWKKITAASGYQVPQTIADFKSLGPFPYFQNDNIWVYPKDHTRENILHFTSVIQKFVGNDFFSRSTVYESIRDEIKLYFTNQGKQRNEWHLSHLVDTILSKIKKRLFVRSVSGLKLEGLEEVKSGTWRLIPFTEGEINNFIGKKTGDKNWKSHLKDYLIKNFKDKICLLIEAEGDLETARSKANNIAAFVINTLRYFICIHISHIGRAHDVGINLDTPGEVWRLNAFSFDLKDRSTTIFGYGARFRQEYSLYKEHFDIIRSQWHAEKLWSLIEKKDLNDLESSIVSSVTWLGDAHQENDINSAYIKYWIALEALITGHRNKDINTRIKNAIPIMISQINEKVPTKTEVGKAYDLRCKVVHCGTKDMVSIHDLNRVCLWVTQCLSLCMHLYDVGYTSRNQIEIQVNRINKAKLSDSPTKASSRPGINLS
jgi:hypothetical protein